MAPPLPPNWFLGAAGSDTPVHTGSSKCSKQAGADSAPCSRSTAALEHGTPSLCLLDLKKKKQDEPRSVLDTQPESCHTQKKYATSASLIFTSFSKGELCSFPLCVRGSVSLVTSKVI